MNIKAAKGYTTVPIVLMGMLAMLILPLPPWLIDMLFTFNIVMAVMVLLVAVATKQPLQFSSFPTVLLLATLMRLGLNVASTRVVLLNGHTGPDAAGQVIQSFGEVVIGGNYVVGMVIFIILMIINFVVITKGGERISEVSARFTLDAMPGKQMAIDADLNAGSLTQDQARERRQEVSREADFYGSMDGASKFVRGDAIAGLLILIINLIGGILIGMTQHGLSGGEAFQLFALLTIGDGLVAQIPSILLATAAAIMVTRVTDESSIGTQIKDQMLAAPSVIFTVAVIMACLGLVPGMPSFVFLTFSAIMAAVGWSQYRDTPVEEVQDDQKEIDRFMQKHPQLTWEEIPAVSKLRIELGFRLVPLADTSKKSLLPTLVRGTRTTLSEQMGFLMPEVGIRDNVDLKPNQYQISIDGAPVARGEVYPNKLFAIEGPSIYDKIDGELVKEPAFDMDAVLIDPDQRSRALNLGYSVADSSTVISTHLNRVVRLNIDKIFSHDDVVQIKERLLHMSEELAKELSAQLKDIQLLQVFRHLLADRVSLSNIKIIATTLIESCENSKDPLLLASDVRLALRRNILHSINGDRPELTVFTLSDSLESTFMASLRQSQQNGRVTMDEINIETELLGKLQQVMPQMRDELKKHGMPAILLVKPILRPQFAKYARTFAVGLNILSVKEVPENIQVNIVGHLG